MPWEPNTINSKILAIHAAFLNFDRVVFFGGDQHDPQLAATNTDATCLFESGSGTVTQITSPHFDTFCSGHALSVEGTLMVAGGTASFPGGVAGLHHDHFPGLRDSAVIRFEQSGHAWHATADMSQGAAAPHHDTRRTGGRWYPTLVTLGNGNVLALSGHPGQDDREHTNYIPEVFTPAPTPRGEWHRLGSYTDATQNQLFSSHQTTYYPRAHLLPTGDVLLASPTPDRKTATLTVGHNPWSAAYAPVCHFTPGDSGQYGIWDETSVLLPLMHEQGYPARVMVCGGEQPWILSLAGWQSGVTPENTLSWRRTAPRKLAGSPRRMTGNAVILPTGEVLVVGGVKGAPGPGGEILKLDSTAVNSPEIYNPFSGKWSALTTAPETAKVARNYHSVALLLRDGRVWTAGSDHNGGQGIANADLRIEIYEPWYQRRPDRPKITAAPDRWLTGETFHVRTTQASQIKRVAMVRCGSCTHAFNSDQRYISLPFDFGGGDSLFVTAPPNGNVSPPGMYFLYTINQKGVPSEGITLYVSADPESEGEREWGNLYHSHG